MVVNNNSCLIKHLKHFMQHLLQKWISMKRVRKASVNKLIENVLF